MHLHLSPWVRGARRARRWSSRPKKINRDHTVSLSESVILGVTEMFSFKQWLRHRKNMIAGSSPRRRKQHPWRLEQLEDRTVPTGLYVDPTYAGQIGSVATFDNQGAVIGTTAFSTLSAAIQQANPGDVINVDGGTYMENVTLNQKVTLSET